MARDVCDENAELAAIQHEEIVEIAGDRAHREIASGNLQASDAGHCARENRGLDLAGDFELFVYGEQARYPSGEGAVGGHIAKAADEKQESENYVVRPPRHKPRSARLPWSTKAPKTARPMVRARYSPFTAVPSRETGE